MGQAVVKSEDWGWLALALVLLAAAACTASISPNACVGFAPILLDPGAVQRLTRGEKEQIAAHNDYGEKHCDWKPLN